MVTFILIGFFAVLIIALIAISYSANQRKRAGQAEIARPPARRQTEGRAIGND